MGATKVLKKNDEILSEIKRLFKSASKIKCAVAFWGKGASNLFPASKAKSIEIVCNLMSGGTNPDEIETIMDDIKKNGEVRMDNSLHAKVFWTNKGMVIGSANASANGLSLEGAEIEGWKEMSVLIEDQYLIKKVEKWFDKVFMESKEIKKKDISDAKKIWKKQSGGRINSGKELSFIEAIKSGVYSNRKIYITIVGNLNKSQIKKGNILKKVLKEKDPELFGENIGFWKDYELIPRKKYVFSFIYENGKITDGSILYTLPKTKDKNGYQFGIIKDHSSINMTKDHFSAIKKAVKYFYKEEIEKIEEDGKEIEISDFVKKLLKRKDILEKL